MPQPIHGCTVHIPVVISRPTPLILRRRLRCPEGKRTSQLYTLSGLLRKLAHNKLNVNTVMLKILITYSNYKLLNGCSIFKTLQEQNFTQITYRSDPAKRDHKRRVAIIVVATANKRIFAAG